MDNNKKLDAYTIGLLASDGHTTKYVSLNGSVNYHSQLEVAEEQIINDLCLKYDKKVFYRERVIKDKVRHFWRITFNNDDIGWCGEYLIKGRPNIFDFYNSLTEFDKSEFVRGVFDGDGTIVINKTRHTVGFSVNSKQEDMRKILLDFANRHNLKVSEYLDKRGAGSWYLSFNNRPAITTFYHLFFDNKPEVKNERKYKIFKEYCDGVV